jgi:hypothetical protein
MGQDVPRVCRGTRSRLKERLRGSLMQQRRLRLGDILDDYCPRERRITNHAIVAMIDDEVKQTRCTTCDADHEYKQARAPAPRRKKERLPAEVPAGNGFEEQHMPDDDLTPTLDELTSDITASPEPEFVNPGESEEAAEAVEAAEPPEAGSDDEGPVHRRLIRATLPRPEGQAPERKGPEFTIRQPGGRGREFEGNRPGVGQRPSRRRRGSRGPQHGQGGGGQPSRFGGRQDQQSRHNSPQGDRQNGNRPAPTGNQRGGGRPGQGQQRGPRPPGRKRGR